MPKVCMVAKISQALRAQILQCPLNHYHLPTPMQQILIPADLALSQHYSMIKEVHPLFPSMQGSNLFVQMHAPGL